MQPQPRYVLHRLRCRGVILVAEEAIEALAGVHTPDYLAILRRMCDTDGDLDLEFY